MQQNKQSENPSRTLENTMGATLFMVFGCFFGMGALLFWLQGGLELHKQKEGAWTSLALGGAFAVLAAIIVRYALSEFRRLNKEKEMRSQFPDEPWKWKPEWTDGVIVDSPGLLMGCFGYAFLLWNTFCIIPFIRTLNKTPFAEDKKDYLIFLLPIIGLALLGCFIYFYFQNRKYGKSVLRLKTFPGVIGEEFVAVLTIPTTVLPTEGIRVKLDNTRTISARGTTNQTDKTITFWEEEKTLTSWKHSQRSTVVEISFQIPADGRPTTMNLLDDFEWGLIVEIKTAGTDYWASFTVPVFDLDNISASTEF
jgi:hypothetical protein